MMRQNAKNCRERRGRRGKRVREGKKRKEREKSEWRRTRGRMGGEGRIEMKREGERESGGRGIRLFASEPEEFNMRHQSYLSSQHFYSLAAHCDRETASGWVEGVRCLEVARKVAFGLSVFNIGLRRTVNLEGAPVTQESWYQCGKTCYHLVPSFQTCFTE